MVGPTLVWPGRVNSMTASRSLLRNTKCKGLGLRDANYIHIFVGIIDQKDTADLRRCRIVRSLKSEIGMRRFDRENVRMISRQSLGRLVRVKKLLTVRPSLAEWSGLYR